MRLEAVAAAYQAASVEGLQEGLDTVEGDRSWTFPKRSESAPVLTACRVERICDYGSGRSIPMSFDTMSTLYHTARPFLWV